MCELSVVREILSSKLSYSNFQEVTKGWELEGMNNTRMKQRIVASRLTCKRVMGVSDVYKVVGEERKKIERFLV